MLCVVERKAAESAAAYRFLVTDNRIILMKDDRLFFFTMTIMIIMCLNP